MYEHITLPESAPGHWDSKDGYEKALEYSTKDRNWLCSGHKTFKEIADELVRLTGHDLRLIGATTAMKENLRWVSMKLLLAKICNEQLEARLTEKFGEKDPLMVPMKDEIDGIKVDDFIVRTRESLPLGKHSDFAIANAQFMASRHDPKLAEYKEAAAVRLQWAVVHLAALDLRNIAIVECLGEEKPEAVVEKEESDLNFYNMTTNEIRHVLDENAKSGMTYTFVTLSADKSTALFEGMCYPDALDEMRKTYPTTSVFKMETEGVWRLCPAHHDAGKASTGS